MTVCLAVLAAVIAVNALVIAAGYRHQSARPEHRHNTNTRGGNCA